jgi:hypothetical protein
MGGKSGENSHHGAMVVKVWKRIRIQNSHLMIFHHNNIPPWRTIIEVKYVSPYAMSIKLLGWDPVV